MAKHKNKIEVLDISWDWAKELLTPEAINKMCF